MSGVKIKYSDLEKMSLGEALEGDHYEVSGSNLSNIIDDIQDTLNFVLDILDEQNGESIKALINNIHDMKDSLRGIENNSEDFVKDIKNYYEDMLEDLNPKTEDKMIEVSDDISDLLKNVKDSSEEYDSLQNKIDNTLEHIDDNFFLINSEEKKAVISRANFALTNTSSIISNNLVGTSTTFSTLIEELKKLDDWVDADKNKHKMQIVGGIAKVALVGAISVALGPVGGIVFSAALATGKAWRNGKSGTEAVVVGAIDAAAGKVLGDATELAAKKVKPAIKALPISKNMFLAKAEKESSIAVAAFALKNPGITNTVEKVITENRINAVTNTMEKVSKSKIGTTISKTDDIIKITSDGYGKANEAIDGLIEKATYEVTLKIKETNLALLKQLEIVASDISEESLEQISDVVAANKGLVDEFSENGLEQVVDKLELEELHFSERVVVGVIADYRKGNKESEIISFNSDSLYEAGIKLDDFVSNSNDLKIA